MSLSSYLCQMRISLIHLMESFREVQKKRRKALATHKNSMNCSYLFLICLKPNLYFSRGIFSSEAKPCPTAELRSARRLPISTAQRPSTRTPRLAFSPGLQRSHAPGSRAEPGPGSPAIPSLTPSPLEARGDATLSQPVRRDRDPQPPPSLWRAATDGAVGPLKRGGGRRRGADGEDGGGKRQTAVLCLPCTNSRLPTLVERNRQSLASAFRATVRPPLSQKPRRGKGWRRRKSRRKKERADGSLPGCDGHSSTPGPLSLWPHASRRSAARA